MGTNPGGGPQYRSETQESPKVVADWASLYKSMSGSSCSCRQYSSDDQKIMSLGNRALYANTNPCLWKAEYVGNDTMCDEREKSKMPKYRLVDGVRRDRGIGRPVANVQGCADVQCL